MKNKSVYLCLVCLLSVVSPRSMFAEPKPEYQVLLDAAKSAFRDYDTNRKQMAAEDARLKYVSALVEIAYRYMSIDKGNAWEHLQSGWEALNREIAKYPAAKNSKGLSKVLVGKWESPRHDYIYYANGKWSMLPIEDGVTSGHWRIDGNQYWDGDVVESGLVTHGIPYTIILLNRNYFVFTNSPKGAFFEERIWK